MKRAIKTLILITLLWLQSYSARAQSTPDCDFQPDGSIVCTTGGGGNDNGGSGGEDTGNVEACIPGEHMVYQTTTYDAATGTCNAYPATVDNCTGQVISSVPDALFIVPCEPQQTQPQHPCTTFSASAAGITCNNAEWKVSARVLFPEIYLDVRPYPATLVRWPTAVRNGGLPESSGSGGVNYISHGGGSRNNPQEGDWKDLRLILTLRAAGPMFISLPHIGDLILADQGATGNPTIIQWEVPSHPAAGGGPLAESVGGLDELPGDMPLFVGHGRAPYKLFWELRYDEYTAKMGCVAGPDDNGNYDCGGKRGHMDVVGYEWKRQSSGGEIPPSAVQNLPAAVMADLNQDGTPDAYWDNDLTLRRMDDNNRVDSPRYQRSWNWNGIIYWAVREGQGQIGWPGE